VRVQKRLGLLSDVVKQVRAFQVGIIHIWCKHFH
jgi:hypothetical protein